MVLDTMYAYSLLSKEVFLDVLGEKVLYFRRSK